MQLIAAHDGKLQTLGALEDVQARSSRTFTTGLDAVDVLAPGGAFACGAVHELLSAEAALPLSLACILTRAAAGGADRAAGRGGYVAWSDPHRTLYPPALAAMGIDLDRLLILKPATAADEVWAVAECLRCKGIAATVASIGQLTRVEARRLQLAAEAGGGAGILLRPVGKRSAQYAAATRWLVEPAEGLRTVQRWKIELVHGHGGRLNQPVLLEVCREFNESKARVVRAAAQLADRPGESRDAGGTVGAGTPRLRIA